LRFDDTNPAKEKAEYEESIVEDLKALGIEFCKVTHSSDYFHQIQEIQTEMIKAGLAYVDNTSREQMQRERNLGVGSKCRNHTIEQNLRLWNLMVNGPPSTNTDKKGSQSPKAAAGGGGGGAASLLADTEDSLAVVEESEIAK
jgi:glutamyl/glutaminyl-tRNA synthetase